MPTVRIPRLVLPAAIGLMAVSLAGFAAPELPVPLTEDGKPKAVIVLPNTAGRRSVEQEAANLLAAFVEKMSGARLDIKREAELDAVRVVGRFIEQGMEDDAIIGFEDVPGEEPLPAPEPLNFVLVGPGELAAELGMDAEGLGTGGIRLRTFGNGVALLGGPAKLPGEPGEDGGGVLYAAVELLERLGCRYLWPGELGMVVPQRATVAVEPLDYSYTPLIRRRGIRWGQNVGHGRFDEPLERLGIPVEKWQEAHRKAIGEAPPVSWSGWQRLGGSMPTFGHSGAGLRDAKRHMEENPEWFALQAEGTRDQGGDSRWRLCKSNPDLIAHVANDIIQRANENPDLELVSLDPNDGGSNAGWCLCDNCMALDPPEGAEVSLLTFHEAPRPGVRRRRETIEYVSLTDRLVHYWNSIAEQVAEVHPNLLFGVSAYSRFTHPPLRHNLHPNLVVRYVPPTIDRWAGWKEAGARRVFWRPNILLQGWNDGKTRVYVKQLAEAMRYFADSGMIQTDINTIRHWWGVHGLNYYAAARLCWNPYLEPEAIVADYAKHGFGAGAASMEQYFRRIEELTEQGVHRTFSSDDDYRFTPEVMAELRSLLNEAERDAAADPDVVQRVRFLRVGLNYTELQEVLAWKTWRAREGQEMDAELTRRLIDLNCLASHEITLNHNLVANIPYQVGRSANFAQFAAIRGRTLTPSDPALLDRVGDPRYGWTGQEQSLEEMLAAFGL